MSGDALVVAEHRRGELRVVSLELLTLARRLVRATGGDLHVAVVSGDVEEYAERLDRDGVDRIHTVAHGEEFNHDVYVRAVEALHRAIAPRYLLAPHTANGIDYVPAVADALALPLVTDATEATHDDGLTAVREMYGSKVETTVRVAAPAVVTVRPGAWPPAEGVGDAAVEAFEVTIDEDRVHTTVRGYEETTAGDVDVGEAEFLIVIGRGIGGADDLGAIEELAAVTGGTLAASGPAVDEGWLPEERRVGRWGRRVSPEVYLAIGISGTSEHVAGVRGAGTVIAIDDDPSAPIFDVADYGIVGDVSEIVSALIRRFEAGE